MASRIVTARPFFEGEDDPAFVDEEEQAATATIIATNGIHFRHHRKNFIIAASIAKKTEMEYLFCIIKTGIPSPLFGI